MEAFRIENLSFTYPAQSTLALRGVSLCVRQGEFLTLAGVSGCGKTTLLRQLKPTLAPNGTKAGEIFCFDRPLSALTEREQAQKIGFVQQSPEEQLVTDKVWHELAFGLESLGAAPQTIRRRTAEMAAFFGMEAWLHKDVSELSGGQKQLLNLAAVTVMQPDILLLDEPTSQLDPIAAAEFLSLLGRINRELGTTVILAEQRLEEAFAYSDRAAVLENGELACVGSPREVGEALRSRAMLAAMPCAMRVWMASKSEPPCPVTVGEGREWLHELSKKRPLAPVPPEPVRECGEAVLRAENVWYRYGRETPDILRGFALTAHRGEITALLGGNGAGKTTALRLLAGALTPQRGKIERSGKIGLLPQDVRALFTQKTVRAELFASAADAEAIARVSALCRLDALLDRHPYDLSGGERQRAALAALLLTKPDALLLDEPTRGLDAPMKRALARLLEALAAQGMSILIVSHDTDFCADCAHRCLMLFDGAVTAEDAPRAFFSGNSFYTTAAARMARGTVPDAVTPEELIAAVGGTLPPEREEITLPPAPPHEKAPVAAPPEKKRTPCPWLSAAITLLALPLTLLLGAHFFGTRKYYLLSLVLMLEAMLPFFLRFERRRPRARELAVLAALCALGVALRAALFMLPQCKPVLAYTVTVGAAFGGEVGFLVGSLTMLVSNMMFGQGPWTPWQMFAMGLVGFLAGTVLRCGKWRENRLAVSLFGAFAALAVYGVLLNVSSALLWVPELTWATVLSYCAAGLPMDCVHAAVTFAFLFFGAKPLTEKLTRIRRKYFA